MATKANLTVIAEFEIKPGQRDRFLEYAREDARQSLANEDGCHEFDVLLPIDDENRVVLREGYTDRAAFDTHTKSPHYQPFKDGAAPLLATDPSVRLFERG